MLKIEGNYGEAIVYNDTVEDTAREQIAILMNQKMSENSHTRIMPDVHAGAGCVIGYTAKLTDYVVPNLVGVDIGCGVTAFRLQTKNKLTQNDLQKIDEATRVLVPHGHDVHDVSAEDIDAVFMNWDDITSPSLEFYHSVKKVAEQTNQDIYYVMRSLGSLGGGNHFCEIDIDNEGVYWLLIHSGSRNFGLKIANYHQKVAKEHTYKQEVSELKRLYSGAVLGAKIAQIQRSDKGLEYLTGEQKSLYLEHMLIATKYANMNRLIIGNIILEASGLIADGYVESVHNYIDFENGIIRKGAISAQEKESLIIPLNMRDGAIIGVGKGNPEWNYSAPHGAGRIMSRTKAKQEFTLKDFQKTMKGIYSTSVTEDTLDESPFAYKDAKEILQYLEPTVDVIRTLKPVWNFKAS